MKVLSVILSFVLLGIFPGELLAQPKTASTTRVWRASKEHPDGGHFAHFIDRQKMKGIRAQLVNNYSNRSAVTLPIDWGKNYDLPMYLNDQLGICYYAAGAHADNVWTANTSTKSEFNLSVMRTRYFALSGGDNGLMDSDMQGEMLNRYLADVKDAKIVSWMYIDTTDAAACQNAIQNFGVVMFTFAVPQRWISDSDTGSIWDVPVPNNNNGHAVIFAGCDSRGYYKLYTWGTYVWLTPAGLKACDPGGWIAFSTRWFNTAGYAPNGLHVTQLAQVWQQGGGKAIPQSVIDKFPPIAPTPPVPPVPPNPPIPGGTVTLTLSGTLPAGSYEILPTGTAEAVKALLRLFPGNLPREPQELMPKKQSHLDDRIERLEKIVSSLVDSNLVLQEAIIGKPAKTSYAPLR